ncbi:MAG: ABC transporter ATP-binding protein [Chloroflexi bacterium]|nr:ABC transporter ATP-binding protein [Chloroflexota bacterium]
MTDPLDAPDIIIQVDDLSKRYEDLRAVDGITFAVERGEVFGILGPNGAGKTTTLECIEGLVEPTKGRTTVLGFDTQREPQKVKQRIGVQLQASAYFDHLTLREILDLFGMFYDRRVDPIELLEQVNLADRADTTVNKLSGGQQQRFTIAATLVNDPEVVFLDEPTTGLDPQARRSLWSFVQGINGAGRTVVLTTHYMEEAEYLCDRIAIMDQGRIVALDTPVNLVRSLPVPYQIKVGPECLDAVDELRVLAAVKEAISEDTGVRLLSADASITVPALMEWARASGRDFSHLEVVPSNLEDVFLSITGHALRE